MTMLARTRWFALVALILMTSAAHAETPALCNDDPVIAALRLRDPMACTALPADPDLAAKLHTIAEMDIAPSWVPMRSATCLSELYAADPRFIEWVTPWFTDPARGGLGVAVLDTAGSNPLARPALEPLVKAAVGRWAAIYARHLPAATAN